MDVRGRFARCRVSSIPRSTLVSMSAIIASNPSRVRRTSTSISGMSSTASSASDSRALNIARWTASNTLYRESPDSGIDPSVPEKKHARRGQTASECPVRKVSPPRCVYPNGRPGTATAVPTGPGFAVARYAAAGIQPPAASGHPRHRFRRQPTESKHRPIHLVGTACGPDALPPVSRCTQTRLSALRAGRFPRSPRLGRTPPKARAETAGQAG